MTAIMEQKVIPMPKAAVPLAETSERAAISCLLQNFANLDAMSWPEDLFFYEKHRIILRAIRELHEAGVSTDFFAVQGLIERQGLLEDAGGVQELIELRTVMPTGDPGTAAWHRGYLMDARRYRTALSAIRKAEEGFLRQEGDIGALVEQLTEAAALQDTPRSGVKEILNAITDELERKEPVESFASGLAGLDRAVSFKRGELLTVAAPTGGGKSIMLLQIALNALRAGKRVALFSLEMPATQVVGRMLSAMCGFNIGVLKYVNREDATNEHLNKYTAASAEMARYPLEVMSGFADWESIDGAARELVAKDKADLIVVDYIQIVHLRALGSNETREQHVSEITKRLKALALQLHVGVATASQVNDDNPPKLRESRAIGQHSDHVWMISSGEQGGFLSVVKQRDGETGMAIPVLMQGATAQFVPRDERDTQPTKNK